MGKVRKYCPSNGSEGDGFISGWCEKCRYEGFTEDTYCAILSDSYVYSVDDDRFPSQWRYDDDGKPVCTAFVADDAGDKMSANFDRRRIDRGDYAGARLRIMESAKARGGE